MCDCVARERGGDVAPGRPVGHKSRGRSHVARLAADSSNGAPSIGSRYPTPSVRSSLALPFRRRPNAATLTPPSTLCCIARIDPSRRFSFTPRCAPSPLPVLPPDLAAICPTSLVNSRLACLSSWTSFLLGAIAYSFM